MNENLLRLIFSSTSKKKTGKRWWVDFGEPGGVYSVTLSLRDVADKLRRDFCYFLCGAFKIVLKRLLILKSQVLACLKASPRARKNNNSLAFLANSWQVAPRFTWWT